jgi:hypothetical protein
LPTQCERMSESEKLREGRPERQRDRDTDRHTDLPLLDGLLPTLNQTAQALISLVVRQRVQLVLQAFYKVLCPCVVHL